MLLFFDAGNTRFKWAIVDAKGVLCEAAAVDYSELESCIEGVVTNYEVSHIAVSSVAGAKRNQCITLLCEQFAKITPRFARVSRQACGIKNNYRALDRLGVDRWVAAMGVANQHNVNRVIVDAGTAVTIDLVDANNDFCGGVILPGAKLMHDSLVGETAGIYSERQAVTTVVGETTQECVNAGVQYGLAGAVDRVIEEIYTLKCNDKPWKVFLCGGDANLISGYLTTKLLLVNAPNVLFDGLLNLYQSGEFK